jgi:hypothetical protein
MKPPKLSNPLSTSEKLFTLIGVSLVAISTALFYFDISWVPNPTPDESDAFAAHYSATSRPSKSTPILEPRSTPLEVTQSTPSPTPATPKPEASVASSSAHLQSSLSTLASSKSKTTTPKSKPQATTAKPISVTRSPTPAPTPDPLQPPERAYLLLPKAHAIFSKTKVNTKPFEVQFKFEVEPKKTPCTLVIEYDKKVVLEKNLKGSPNGTFLVKVKLSKAGQYFWKVITQKNKSERRELIIKN